MDRFIRRSKQFSRPHEQPIVISLKLQICGLLVKGRQVARERFHVIQGRTYLRIGAFSQDFT